MATTKERAERGWRLSRARTYVERRAQSVKLARREVVVVDDAENGGCTERRPAGAGNLLERAYRRARTRVTDLSMNWTTARA